MKRMKSSASASSARLSSLEGLVVVIMLRMMQGTSGLVPFNAQQQTLSGFLRPDSSSSRISNSRKPSSSVTLLELPGCCHLNRYYLRQFAVRQSLSQGEQHQDDEDHEEISIIEEGDGQKQQQRSDNSQHSKRKRKITPHVNSNNHQYSQQQQEHYLLDRQSKKEWLEQATTRLLETEPGTLTKGGQWHQVVSLFHAWASWSKIDAAAPLRMESLLKRLLDEKTSAAVEAAKDEAEQQQEVIPITMDLYNKLLDAWACAALFDTPGSAAKADAVTNDDDTAATALIPSRHAASQRAREILVLLQEKYESTMGDELLMPTRESFFVVLHVVCKTEGVFVARRLLAWMEFLSKSGKNLNATPLRTDYLFLLDAYLSDTSTTTTTTPTTTSSSTLHAGVLANAFLRHMTTVGVAPCVRCYNIAMKAWNKARRGTRDAAEHADRLLEEMMASGIEPDEVTYVSVISAWASSGMRAHAVTRAEELLHQLQETLAAARQEQAQTQTTNPEQHQHPPRQPNTLVWNAIMSAWVKSRSPAAVQRTFDILRQMEESSTNDPNSNMRPDLFSYNTYLHALSMHSLKHPEYAVRAQQLLDKMEALSSSISSSVSVSSSSDGEDDSACGAFHKDFSGPNAFSYNLVIDAYCRSHQPMRAADILRRLVKRDGVEPDTFSFNQVLSALSRAPATTITRTGGNEKSNSNSYVQIAEQLLHYMEKSFQDGVHPNAPPDTISYASVLFAYSKSGQKDAPEKAEALLESMRQRHLDRQSVTSVGSAAAGGKAPPSLKPNRICYNALIDCWAKSGQGTRGARKAELLLHEMQRISEDAGDPDMAPNIVTYNSVLNAWARSGTRCCGHKAEYYLNRMWELYQAGNERVKPNDLSYNTVINAISKSQNEGKAQKALRILRRMDKLYRAGNKEARPNEITYTAVLNSCAFPAVLDEQTRRKALHTAIFTLEELQSSRYGQPNQVTYGTFIKACANLLDDDNDALRRTIIQKVFEQCCKDGQCGDMVINYVRKAAPSDLFEQLFAGYLRTGGRIYVEDLPPEWRCNIREKDGWREKKTAAKKNNNNNKRFTTNRRPRITEGEKENGIVDSYQPRPRRRKLD